LRRQSRNGSAGVAASLNIAGFRLPDRVYQPAAGEARSLRRNAIFRRGAVSRGYAADRIGYFALNPRQQRRPVARHARGAKIANISFI
jgi:hypothetical protein